ncbi:unnamed protein product [Lymnaea stagnalis]|uniref:Uncharacterized protein n=1 Tax=Lymnaea stagnalis TaxID=6523 RepID=A0AAV2H001_LYMST
MSEHNVKCHLCTTTNAQNALAECAPIIRRHPMDMTYTPICPRRPPPSSTMIPNCGCPDQSLDDESICCCMPDVLETRVLRRPQTCVKMPCNYCIPAVPCQDPPKPPKPLARDPLCFDWTVDEPGPNDSYGHKGLNWYDWKMGTLMEINFEEKLNETSHPGLSNAPVPTSITKLVCQLPVMCYARSPVPCKTSPFATDVNYFRDWRACEAKPPPPWKAPYAQWATNQNL